MSKITQSARGEMCAIRIPRVCNFNPETTVLAHINGAGMGLKAHDIHGAYACSACHDAIDSRIKTEYDRDDLLLMHLQGVMRTQQALINKGLITTKQVKS